MNDGDELLTVYSTDSASDGYLAKGRLEADGIPVMIKGELDGPYRTGAMFLQVPAKFEVQARAILESVAELAEQLSEEDDPG